MANSSVRTSAGTTLSISAGISATNILSEMSALAYTPVGEISDLGSFGKKYNLVTFSPLDNRKVVKRKGSYNNGTLTLKMGSSVTDAGQVLMQSGLNSDNSYTFRVITQAGNTYYFTGQIMSFVLEIGSVDQIMGASADIEIDNDIVFQGAVAPPDPTPSQAQAASAPYFNGTPQVNTPLSITAGTFSGGYPAPTLSRVIYANGTSVSTSGSYTPTSADVGKVFSIDDIASNGSGTTHNTSSNSVACIAAFTAANAVSAPVINGTPTVDTPLSITAGTFSGANPAATITRKIYANNGVVASGSASTSYTPVSGDVGKVFKVEDIATNSVNATSNMSATSAACVAATTTPVPSTSSNAVGNSAIGSTAI